MPTNWKDDTDYGKYPMMYSGPPLPRRPKDRSSWWLVLLGVFLTLAALGGLSVMDTLGGY